MQWKFVASLGVCFKVILCLDPSVRHEGQLEGQKQFDALVNLKLLKNSKDVQLLQLSVPVMMQVLPFLSLGKASRCKASWVVDDLHIGGEGSMNGKSESKRNVKGNRSCVGLCEFIWHTSDLQGFLKGFLQGTLYQNWHQTRGAPKNKQGISNLGSCRNYTKNYFIHLALLASHLWDSIMWTLFKQHVGLIQLGVQAGMKKSNPVAFYVGISSKRIKNINTTTTTAIPTMASFCPLQQHWYFIYSPSNANANTNAIWTRGWARTWLKHFNSIVLLIE